MAKVRWNLGSPAQTLTATGLNGPPPLNQPKTENRRTAGKCQDMEPAAWRRGLAFCGLRGPFEPTGLGGSDLDRTNIRSEGWAELCLKPKGAHPKKRKKEKRKKKQKKKTCLQVLEHPKMLGGHTDMMFKSPQLRVIPELDVQPAY